MTDELAIHMTILYDVLSENVWAFQIWHLGCMFVCVPA